MQFDSYIQNRIQSFMADCTKEGMEPSDDFSNKVMESCICAERSRAKKLNIALILLSLSPFIGRQFWMLIRGDHFSVMHWPFGKMKEVDTQIQVLFQWSLHLLVMLMPVIQIILWISIQLLKIQTLIQEFADA